MNTGAISTELGPMHAALAAAGRSPDIPEAMDCYGWLIGSWDCGPGSPKFANWFGTTLRIYDPSIQAWRANWFNPHDGVRAEQVGRRQGNQVVQEGTFPDGTPIRWTFSDITDDSFRWRGERLEPDGKTWRLQVEFHARRFAAQDTP